MSAQGEGVRRRIGPKPSKADRAEGAVKGLPAGAQKFTHNSTGEEMWAVVPVKAVTRMDRDYITVYQTALETMSRDRSLKLLDYRVRDALLGRLDFDNWIHVPQRVIARSLEIDPGDVSKAVKKLCEMKFLQKGPKVGTAWTYRLDPSFAWKGKHEHWRGAEATYRKGLTVIAGGKADEVAT